MVPCDCLVLGVGGFGSAALYHLARRGVRAIGLERFDVAHDRGSSHGETRIIRQAYFEHPDYVPLLLRAYALWDELAAESDRTLMSRCGLLLCGPPDGEAISGARLAARLHDLPLESPDPATAAARFPAMRFPPGHALAFEAQAGYLHVERCVRTHVERALARGAELRTGETIVDRRINADGVEVRTDRETYVAPRAIVTAGPWASELLADLALPLQVVRKPVAWFPVRSRDQDESRGMPTFLFERGERVFYGFPSLDGRTMKVAEHTGGERVADPLHVDRSLRDADLAGLAEFVRDTFPAVGTVPERHSVCLYTLTPDRHFAVDLHPHAPQIALGAGFSGHGFKFTSVLGEALADLALEGRTGLPIGFLGLDRFA